MDLHQNLDKGVYLLYIWETKWLGFESNRHVTVPIISAIALDIRSILTFLLMLSFLYSIFLFTYYVMQQVLRNVVCIYRVSIIYNSSLFHLLSPIVSLLFVYCFLRSW